MNEWMKNKQILLKADEVVGFSAFGSLQEQLMAIWTALDEDGSGARQRRFSPTIPQGTLPSNSLKNGCMTHR